MDNNKVYICRPCAEKLKGDGLVKMYQSVKDKHTCDVCKCRRFVYLCSYVKSDNDE